MNAKGENTRKRICDEYEVTPVSHMMLLPGQVIHGDAGKDITKSYYVFSAIRNEEEDHIVVGERAASSFLKILDHESLPIFNPLHLEERNYVNNQNRNNDNANNNEQRDEWNQLSRQLYNACNLYAMITGAKVYYGILDIARKVYSFRSGDKYILEKILSANRYLEKCFETREEDSLTELIRKSNYNFRENFIDFGLINDELRKQGETSYF